MCPHHVCRDACAIADGDTVVLTGGQNTMRRVSRYGTGGWLEDLPSMNLGRADHGCASFLQEGDKVSAAPAPAPGQLRRAGVHRVGRVRGELRGAAGRGLDPGGAAARAGDGGARGRARQHGLHDG